jgi:ATP-dependent Clp protease ATP-binding subunit ClpX
MKVSRALSMAAGAVPCRRCALPKSTSTGTPFARRVVPAYPMSTSHRAYSSLKRPEKTPLIGRGKFGEGSTSSLKSGISKASSAVATNSPPVPRSIVAYLDEYVIGQDTAKKALAVGVFNHYLRATFNQKTAEDIARHSYLFPTKKIREKRSLGKSKNAEEEETILSDFVGQQRGSKRWGYGETGERPIETHSCPSILDTDLPKEAVQAPSLSPTYFSSARPSKAEEVTEEPASAFTDKQAHQIQSSPRKTTPESHMTQLDKSNMIVIGPSGSGKTHLIRTLSASLSVPFVHVDATPLTSAGYVGEDVDSIIARLLESANWNVEDAERGIICIDEVDKLASPVSSSSPGSIKTAGRDVGGTGVQQALLRLLEGSIVSIADKRNSSSAPSHPNNHGTPRHSKKGNAESKPWWSPEMQQLNAEQQGKIVPSERSSGGSVAEATLVEGKRKAGLHSGSDGMGTVRVDTSKILFVLCGAFVGLEDIIAARGGRMLEDVEAEDLNAYGLIPEFVGRLPVMVTLKDLTETELERILTEPRNALVTQYQTLFAAYDIKLHFTSAAISSLAHQAAQVSTTSSGARMLRRLMEKRLLDAMYDGPGGGSRYALMDESAAQGRSQVQLFSRGGRSAWLNAIEEDEERNRRPLKKAAVGNGSKGVSKSVASSSSSSTSSSVASLQSSATTSSSQVAVSPSKKTQTRSLSHAKSLFARVDEATLRRRARARLTRPSRVGNLRILTSDG